MKIIPLDKIPEKPTSHNAVGKKKLLIGQNEINFLHQFAQVTFLPGEVVSEHVHEDLYEIFLVEKGSGIIKINGTDHAFTQGTSIVVEPGELHEVTNTGSEDLILTYFSIIKKTE